jgi:hypothetical protein
MVAGVISTKFVVSSVGSLERTYEALDSRLLALSTETSLLWQPESLFLLNPKRPNSHSIVLGRQTVPSPSSPSSPFSSLVLFSVSGLLAE